MCNMHIVIVEKENIQAIRCLGDKIIHALIVEYVKDIGVLHTKLHIEIVYPARTNDS